MVDVKGITPLSPESPNASSSSAQKHDDTMLPRIKEVFQRYNTRGDGVLTIQELSKALVGLGGLKSDQVDEICDEVDDSKDGKVSYKEFRDWLRKDTEVAQEVWAAIKRKTGDARTIRIKETFAKYDRSGDGSLDIEEMRTVLKSLGSFTNHEIAVVCKDLDKSGDGEIDYQEFEDWIRSGAGAKEIMKAKAILAPSDDDGLDAVFYKFCGAGNSDMNGKSFLKMLRDVKVLNSSLTETHVDLIYSNNKVKPKGARTIDFKQFEIALDLVAEKAGTPIDVIRHKLLMATGPVIVGTVAEAVKFHERPEGGIREPAKRKVSKRKPKPRSPSPVETRQATTEDMKEVWKAFGINTVAGRTLRRLYGADVYTPSAPERTYKSSWPPEPQTFVAVNALRTTAYGLQYRRTMRLNDFCRGIYDYLPWGERVEGRMVGNNWLKVGDRYLPTKVNGVPFIQRWGSTVQDGNDGPSVAVAAGTKTLAGARSASLPALMKPTGMNLSDGAFTCMSVGSPIGAKQSSSVDRW